MAAHDYHPHCPHYDARQVLHDGCGECEARGKDFTKWAAAADSYTWEHAWRRAYDLHASGGDRASLGYVTDAEDGILRTLWSFQVMLESRGFELTGRLPAFDQEVKYA